jgi:Family of unknown function (DUF6188)
MSTEAYGSSMVGWEVRRCCIGFRAELTLAGSRRPDAPEGLLALTGVVRIAHGATIYDLDVSGPKEKLGPLLGVVGLGVASCTVMPDGELVVGFDQGWRMGIAADRSFEAWELRTPAEYLVCQPGGVVSAWLTAE